MRITWKLSPYNSEPESGCDDGSESSVQYVDGGATVSAQQVRQSHLQYPSFHGCIKQVRLRLGFYSGSLFLSRGRPWNDSTHNFHRRISCRGSTPGSARKKRLIKCSCASSSRIWWVELFIRVAVSSFLTLSLSCLSDRWESVWNEEAITRISNSNCECDDFFQSNKSENEKSQIESFWTNRYLVSMKNKPSIKPIKKSADGFLPMRWS